MHTIVADPLSSWLFPKVRMAVLSRLLLDRREWHARELARVTGLNHAAVGKELAAMAEAGVALSRRSGNRIYYSANIACSVHHELLMLVTKTAGIADALRRALAPLSDRISMAYIFGSMATGSGRSHSDIDLMVVGSISVSELIEALADAEDQLRREVNSSVFSQKEYQQKLAEREGFIHDVHHGERLMLIGADHETQ